MPCERISQTNNDPITFRGSPLNSTIGIHFRSQIDHFIFFYNLVCFNCRCWSRIKVCSGGKCCFFFKTVYTGYGEKFQLCNFCAFRFLWHYPGIESESSPNIKSRLRHGCSPGKPEILCCDGIESQGILLYTS